MSFNLLLLKRKLQRMKKTKSETSSTQIFLWNMLGIASTALISIVLLMIVSRTSSKGDADIFSYAYAVGNQMVTIGLFQIRNYQSTDINQKYQFREYFYARLFTCMIMIMSSIIFLLFSQVDLLSGLVVLLICIYRCTDAFSDVYQGAFQQQERLDIAGKSLFLRNVLVMLFFTISLIFSKNIIMSVAIICLVSSLAILKWDVIPFKHHYSQIAQSTIQIRRILNLLKENLPLFINGFLLIYIYNQPKFTLASLYSQGKVVEGVQTEFNILFMPIFVINLVFLFLRPMVTQMAIFYAKQNKEAFTGLGKKLVSLLIMSSIVILIASYFLGLPVLSFVYGIDLKQYKLVFLLLIFGGVVSTFATMLDNFLTIMRKQYLLLFPYALSFVAAVILTPILASKYYLIGITISFNISMVIWLVISMMLYMNNRLRF